MFVNLKRSPQAQTLHDTLVKALANKFVSDGYTVWADISGFTQPPKIGDYIPDIYAVKGASKIIAEAETCDTICIDHTREQYTVFSNVRETEFHVITPESCLSEAKDCASTWGITVDQWWQQNGY